MIREKKQINLNKAARKLFLALLLGSVLSGSSVYAAKSNEPKIGVVDPQYVLSKYGKAQKAIKDLKTAEASFQSKLQRQREELSKAKSKKDITKTELELIAQEGIAKLEPEAKKLEQQSSKYSKEIQQEVQDAIEQLAKDGKYDWILLKSAVLYGGEAVDDQVIKKLN